MEMFYFTLGVLTIVALCLVGVVIMGMIKVQKIQKEFLDWRESYRWDLENSHRRFDESYRDNQEKFTNFYRDLDKLHQECVSYTDKRIDKVIYHYQEKEN